MSISLKKGEKINLTKESPNLIKARLRLNWSPQIRVGEKFDVDASVMILGDSSPLDEDFIYFRNKIHPSGVATLDGDDRNGGKGENIDIDLSKIPKNKNKLVFAININEAIERKQNFGQIKNCVATLINSETKEEIVKFDLGEEFDVETCVIACEIYKYNDEWKFNAVGQGYHNGLDGLLKEHGYDVE